MGAVEARVRKFQVFCKDWNTHLLTGLVDKRQYDLISSIKAWLHANRDHVNLELQSEDASRR
jgi:hypothetical protein